MMLHRPKYKDSELCTVKDPPTTRSPIDSNGEIGFRPIGSCADQIEIYDATVGAPIQGQSCDG